MSGGSWKTSHTGRLPFWVDQLLGGRPFINERRILYQPIQANVLLQRIEFQVVGVSIEVSEFGLDELIPRL